MKAAYGEQKTAAEGAERPIVRSETQASAGKKFGEMRYVLMIGTIGALIGMGVAWLFVAA